jgi:hypothetical protein
MSNAVAPLLVRYLMSAVWSLFPKRVRDRLSKPVGGPLLLAGVILGALGAAAILFWTTWTVAGRP